MLSRRGFAGALGAAVAVGVRAGAAETARLMPTEDGLYREPWFLESFLDLADDLETAGKSGKRLAVMWELRGCPACREIHLINFARPDIARFVSKHFAILQLNIVGSRKVTDFDNSQLWEKRLAAKYGVTGTPTLQFFPRRMAGLSTAAADQREVARMEGYLEPDEFLAMFHSLARAA